MVCDQKVLARMAPRGTGAEHGEIMVAGDPAELKDLVRDDEQTAITARGKALHDYVVSNNRGVSAAVTAAIKAAEARFRVQHRETWFRRPPTVPPLRLLADSDRDWLQALADYNALWGGNAEVPGGIFTVPQSVFVTQGLAFPWSHGLFRGAGVNFDASSAWSGTAVVLTATDRPALIDQGGRQTTIADLTLRGPLRDHIFDNNLGVAGVTIDDTVHSAWDSPPISDRRWAPLAGIAVDPYADTAPAVPYPAASPPAYLGPASQHYGRQVSSDTLIERVMITGFNTGIVVHPSGGVSQSDYVHGRTVHIYGAKYGLSVCNSQSRLPTFDHLLMARLYCGFTNRQHGAQQGFFGGVATNNEIGSCIKVLDFDLSYIGRFTLDGAYSEACWQLGDIRGAGAVDGTLSFRGSEFQMAFASGDYVPLRGIPKYILGDPTSTTGYQGTGQITFEDTLLYFRTACPLMARNVSLNRVTLYGLEAAGAAANTARAIAHNGSLGLLMPPGARPDPAIVAGPRFNVDTLAVDASIVTDANFRETDRNSLIPWFVRKARPRNHSDDRYAVDVPLVQVGVPASGYALRAQSGITVNLTQALGAEAANNLSQAPGVVVLHDLDGRWYYLKSRDYRTGAVVLEALTDYHDAGAGNVLRSPYAATGTLYFFETRFFTPREAILGDVSSGSPVISNLRTTAGGSVRGLSGEVAVGDYLWDDPQLPAGSKLFASARNRNKVTAVDWSGGTMALSGNADVTRTGARLGLFIRGT
jgi:hypothetical protein